MTRKRIQQACYRLIRRDNWPVNSKQAALIARAASKGLDKAPKDSFDIWWGALFDDSLDRLGITLCKGNKVIIYDAGYDLDSRHSYDAMVITSQNPNGFCVGHSSDWGY